MVTSRQVDPASTALRRGRDDATGTLDRLGAILASAGDARSEFR